MTMHRLAAPVQAELIVKKSRFLGFVHPVDGRAEAMRCLADIRRRLPGAAHYCSVLVCPGDSSLDDDGEPSGTAARPIYNVLQHKDVDHVFAVVVRYWGGIKLGAGGLARAYGHTISEAMKTAELVPVELTCERLYTCAFALEAALRRLAEHSGVSVRDAAYAEAVSLRLVMKASQAETFEREARNLLRGELEVLS
jgi:uncharacterized YigZ family protein